MKNIKLLNKKYVCEKTKMLAFKSEISQTLKIYRFRNSQAVIFSDFSDKKCELTIYHQH